MTDSSNDRSSAPGIRTTSELELVTIDRASREYEGLLAAFHAGIYLDAFASQREPLEVWQRALWGAAPRYELTVRIAGHALHDPARRDVLGGVAYERYPQSGCGLVTYMVIAPPARRQGLGRRLQGDAVRALRNVGAPAVFGEINDPRRIGAGVDEPPIDMWRRVRRNMSWGARVLDMHYVQPALAPGLARDHGLCLLALAGANESLPAAIDGAIVRAFVHELYAITEGNAPDRELLAGIPDRFALIELGR
jgi:GNAT superfamily N-acetyltransferase